MTKTDELMARVFVIAQDDMVDSPQWDALRTAIEQALGDEYDRGFKAAIREVEEEDPNDRAAYTRLMEDHWNR
jgi:hypothetical protein